MNSVLMTISRGIIDRVSFFDNPELAVTALSKRVSEMNKEHEDAAVYDSEGMIANAKHFLNENDEFRENPELINDVEKEGERPIYIIANPQHHLGFMITSPDDPLGYIDPVEALSDLGQMRHDYGRHLKLFRVISVEGPVADIKSLEIQNKNCDVEGFDYSLIEKYLI